MYKKCFHRAFQTMRSDKFGSQLDWKSKTWFFTFLNVYVFWIKWDKFLILQFSPSQFRYFTDQNGPKELGDRMKTNFDIFQIQKRISQTVRSQKVDEKKGVICQVFFFSSWVMVLKLTKIVHFLQICADLSKKSKSIKAIYLYPSERPHHALSKNSMFYRGLSNSSRDIEE